MSLARMAGAADIRVLSVAPYRMRSAPWPRSSRRRPATQVVLTVGSPAMAMQKIKAERFSTRSSPRKEHGRARPGWNRKSGKPRAARQHRARRRSARGRAGARRVDTRGFQAGAAGRRRSIVYGDPTLRHQSGEKTEKVLAKAGFSRRSSRSCGSLRDKPRARR